jgi:hypothetical protein
VPAAALSSHDAPKSGTSAIDTNGAAKNAAGEPIRIARECEGRAGADSGTLDRGDRRFRRSRQLGGCRELPPHPAARGFGGFTFHIRERIEVTAGAERATAAGEQQDTDILGGVRRGHHLRQPVQQRPVQRVAAVGPVEREDRDSGVHRHGQTVDRGHVRVSNSRHVTSLAAKPAVAQRRLPQSGNGPWSALRRGW